VAQYLLDVPYRTAVEEESRGHRVPEHVRRHGLREADRPAEAPEPDVGALELQRLDMRNLYDKSKEDVGLRRKWAEQCGLGFELPSVVLNVLRIVEKAEAAKEA
jgi:hypothetical protein